MMSYIDLVENPGIIEGVDSKTLAIMFAAVRDTGMSVTLTNYAGSIMSNAAMLEVGESECVCVHVWLCLYVCDFFCIDVYIFMYMCIPLHALSLT